jgi:hypothetical protein
VPPLGLGRAARLGAEADSARRQGKRRSRRGALAARRRAAGDQWPTKEAGGGGRESRRRVRDVEGPDAAGSREAEKDAVAGGAGVRPKRSRSVGRDRQRGRAALGSRRGRGGVGWRPSTQGAARSMVRSSGFEHTRCGACASGMDGRL